MLTDKEHAAPIETMGIAQGAPAFMIDAIGLHGKDLTIVCLGA